MPVNPEHAEKPENTEDKEQERRTSQPARAGDAPEKDNSQYTILAVDDEPEIAGLIEIYLTGEGYKVLKAYDGKEALGILQSQPVSLAILDIMMPGMDGIELCRRLREFSNIPVIFLSAKSTDVDKVRGLDIGADDYITKPFNPPELIARVHSQLRRYTTLNNNDTAEPETPNEINIRGLTIQRDAHAVFVDGKKVRMTPLEFEILWLLASHPGKVFSTDDIFREVWKENVYEANNTVMVHIRRIRTKIGDDDRENKIIDTVWGIGYKIG
ncbi:MAG: response regulator transcription factor [Lachnospiraceae bacterium]|jgi:two-component system response regulator VanR